MVSKSPLWKATSPGLGLVWCRLATHGVPAHQLICSDGGGQEDGGGWEDGSGRGRMGGWEEDRRREEDEGGWEEDRRREEDGGGWEEDRRREEDGGGWEEDRRREQASVNNRQRIAQDSDVENFVIYTDWANSKCTFINIVVTIVYVSVLGDNTV